MIILHNCVTEFEILKAQVSTQRYRNDWKWRYNIFTPGHHRHQVIGIMAATPRHYFVRLFNQPRIRYSERCVNTTKSLRRSAVAIKLHRRFEIFMRKNTRTICNVTRWFLVLIKFHHRRKGALVADFFSVQGFLLIHVRIGGWGMSHGKYQRCLAE